MKTSNGKKEQINGVRITVMAKTVDKKKIEKLKNEVEKFNLASNKSINPKKYAKNALKVKSANIIANIGISSFLLAVALPEITFYLRKKITGSDAEPGLNT